MLRNSTNTLKVFAFNHNTAHPQTGDAANITCRVSLDGAAAVALADTNPTEMEDGYYLFNVTAAESNGVTADFFPESSTNNVQVICAEHSRYLTEAIYVPNIIGTVVPRTQQTTLRAYVGETYTFTISTLDGDGNVVDCSSMPLQVVIETRDRDAVTVVPNGSITKTSTTVTFTVADTYHTVESQYIWALRRTDTGVVIMHGAYAVQYAADN